MYFEDSHLDIGKRLPPELSGGTLTLNGIFENLLLDLLKEANLPISDPPPTCLEEVPPEHLREIITSVRTLYEWDSATNMAIAQGCSFQDIFDLSEPMLANPAVLYDYMTQVSAHTRHIPCDDPIFQKAIELGRMPDELLRFMLDDVTRVFPQIITDTPVVIEHKISPHPEIVCQIKINDRFVGYLYVQCVNQSLSEGLLDFIHLLAKKLQILAQREQNGTMGVHLADGDAERLLAQITEGVVQNSAMIASALAAHGLPMEGKFLLYLISTLGPKEVFPKEEALLFLFPVSRTQGLLRVSEKAAIIKPQLRQGGRL